MNLRRTFRPARRAVAIAMAVLVLSVGTAGVANAAGTPRGQFWVDANFTGDKLDKDVQSTGYAQESDLIRLGRGCYVFGCSGNWNDVITSLSTTGGGQSPVHLIAYEHTGFRGACLYVPPNYRIGNLSNIRVWLPNGNRVFHSWNDRISSFEVGKDFSDAGFYNRINNCEIYVP